MTDTTGTKRRRILETKENWYCVRAKKHAEPSWPSCKNNLEEDDVLVFNNTYSSRKECDNVCGRLPEALQFELAPYFKRIDMEALKAAAPAKNVGFQNVSKYYEDVSILHQMSQKSDFALFSDDNYISRVLSLVSKKNTGNWAFIPTFIELLVHNLKMFDISIIRLSSISKFIKGIIPLMKHHISKGHWRWNDRSRYLFEILLERVQNCKFLTELVEDGLLDFGLATKEVHNTNALKFFKTVLFDQETQETKAEKWNCWARLFESYLSKSDFSKQIPTPVTQNFYMKLLQLERTLPDQKRQFVVQVLKYPHLTNFIKTETLSKYVLQNYSDLPSDLRDYLLEKIHRAKFYNVYKIPLAEHIIKHNNATTKDGFSRLSQIEKEIVLEHTRGKEPQEITPTP